MKYIIKYLKLDSQKNNPDSIVFRLDEVLTAAYLYPKEFGPTTLQNWLNAPEQTHGNPQKYLDHIQMFMLFNKIRDDGFIHKIDTGYIMTVEGKLFVENVPIDFKNRPYQYREVLSKLDIAWKVLKVFGVIINAIALIIIGILTIGN